jgi:hypothetical protein
MDPLLSYLLGTTGVAGFFGASWWLFATGRILTRREADGKDQEIHWLRERNEVLVTALLEQGSTTTQVLTGIRDAAREATT